MMAGVAELIGRGVVARIAAERSYLGVCLASPAAWVLAGGLLIAMYYYIMNVHMKKMLGIIIRRSIIHNVHCIAVRIQPFGFLSFKAFEKPGNGFIHSLIGEQGNVFCSFSSSGVSSKHHGSG